MTAQSVPGRSQLPRPGLIHIRLTTIGWTAAGAGALVVFVAIGFLVPLFGSLHELARLALINGPLVAVYLIVSGVLVSRHFGRHVSDTLAWVREDRLPDEREHEQTLRLATYPVKIDVLAWIVAGVLFGVIDTTLFSPGMGALVLGTIWLGGETTCALDYMLYERALRPVTACALAARPRRACVAPGVRARLGMAWSLGTGVPLLGLLVVGIAGLVRPHAHASDVAEAVLFLSAVAWVAGFFMLQLAAKAISDPLLAVRRGVHRHGRLYATRARRRPG